MKTPQALFRPWLLVVLLSLAVITLYARSLTSPFVFDDLVIFTNPESLLTYGLGYFSFDLRWLPYATLLHSANWFGHNVAWLRSGNVLLHAANVITLFFLLRRIFQLTLDGNGMNDKPTPGFNPVWFAFFGAMLFALHPVAVYGVAYLIQRSILMATLFVLLMLFAYLEGLLRNSWRWMLVAALCYFAAVYSKEHSIMAPGVALALTLLFRQPSVALFKLVAPFFLLAALSAFTVLLSVKGLLGTAYEPSAEGMLGQAARVQGLTDLSNVHLLSILTQAWLFFKYLGLWLLPNPAWMSVDMREPFAMSWSAWPYTLGAVLFIAYPCVAVWLLLKRGAWGLLGLAMLFPWILFLTEMSVVRIQEPFVLYRSYLWMPGLCLALPALLGWLDPKKAWLLLIAICLALVPLSLNRLQSFSSPLALWDDAEKLVRDKPNVFGVERIYYRYGTELLRLQQYDKAISILNQAISANPGDDYVYINRAAAYYSLRRYQEALLDFNRAISLNPETARSYYGRALTYQALGNFAAAKDDFKKSCAQKLCP